MYSWPNSLSSGNSLPHTPRLGRGDRDGDQQLPPSFDQSQHPWTNSAEGGRHRLFSQESTGAVPSTPNVSSSPGDQIVPNGIGLFTPTATPEATPPNSPLTGMNGTFQDVLPTMRSHPVLTSSIFLSRPEPLQGRGSFAEMPRPSPTLVVSSERPTTLTDNTLIRPESSPRIASVYSPRLSMFSTTSRTTSMIVSRLPTPTTHTHLTMDEPQSLSRKTPSPTPTDTVFESNVSSQMSQLPQPVFVWKRPTTTSLPKRIPALSVPTRLSTGNSPQTPSARLSSPSTLVSQVTPQPAARNISSSQCTPSSSMSNTETSLEQGSNNCQPSKRSSSVRPHQNNRLRTSSESNSSLRPLGSSKSQQTSTMPSISCLKEGDLSSLRVKEVNAIVYFDSKTKPPFIKTQKSRQLTEFSSPSSSESLESPQAASRSFPSREEVSLARRRSLPENIQLYAQSAAETSPKVVNTACSEQMKVSHKRPSPKEEAHGSSRASKVLLLSTPDTAYPGEPVNWSQFTEMTSPRGYSSLPEMTSPSEGNLNRLSRSDLQFSRRFTPNANSASSSIVHSSRDCFASII